MIKECFVKDLTSICRPTLIPPTEVSCFSIDDDNKLNFNKSNTPVLNEKIFNLSNIDILSKFEATKVHTEKNRVCEYILHLLLDLQKREIIFPMKFISYRRTMGLICNVPYEDNKDMNLVAIKLNGKIFLWWNKTRDLDKSPSLYSLKCIYSGRRFKKLLAITSDDNNDDEVFNPESFFSAVRTNLTCNSFSHNLFYIGKVDCIRQSNNKYVEINSRINRDDYALKRYCFLKWWLYSYLMGIDTVIVGYRNDNFIVEDIVEYDIKSFYRSTRNLHYGKELWNPNVCFGFLGNFLTEVENVMVDFKDSDICVIDFKAKPKKITFKKTTQTESPEYDFLPPWFRSEWSG